MEVKRILFFGKNFKDAKNFGKEKKRYMKGVSLKGGEGSRESA